MKNKGFSFVELIIALTLFFITIFPMMNYYQSIVFTNNRFFSLEKNFKNFKSIKKQLENMEVETLKNRIGSYQYDSYTFGEDWLTNTLFLPYELQTDIKIQIDISRVIYSSENEDYPYIFIQLMYINNNKIFKSEFLLEKLEEI